MENIAKQREFFQGGHTMAVATRLDYLKKLYATIQRYEEDIERALHSDLGKSPCESYMCEVGMCLSELSHIIKHTKRWAKPQRAPTSLAQFHAKSFTVKTPLGVVLIMSPWNYPFMLTMDPLFGAIAAGNCCVVKPSAYSPQTSQIIQTILEEVFPPEYVTVVSGGRGENEALLNLPFDHIFFTGSTEVGKIVMEKAAKNLTSVTLELGGKSPCIVDETANINVAAKRIAFGKFLNCGQTCVAPDYILVHASKKQALLDGLTGEITAMYGRHPLDNPDYGKIINQKHFDRLLGLINREKLVFGGESRGETGQIAPTILDGVTTDDAVMQEEIFGPILPILTYETFEEVEEIMGYFGRPLAGYLFSDHRARQQYFAQNMIFGGGCINDCIVHLASSTMPFGGVGASGMGRYHGVDSFDTFSHQKSILQRYNWIDLPLRYQPYPKWDKKVLKFFLK